MLYANFKVFILDNPRIRNQTNVQRIRKGRESLKLMCTPLMNKAASIVFFFLNSLKIV